MPLIGIVSHRSFVFVVLSLVVVFAYGLGKDDFLVFLALFCPGMLEFVFLVDVISTGMQNGLMILHFIVGYLLLEVVMFCRGFGVQWSFNECFSYISLFYCGVSTLVL